MINFIDKGGWLLILSLWVVILSFCRNRKAAQISTIALMASCSTVLVGEALFSKSVYVEAITANGLIFAVAAYVARRYSMNALSWVFVASTVCYYIIYIYASAGVYLSSGYYLMLIPTELLIVIFSVGARCGQCSIDSRGGDMGGNLHDTGGELK